MNDGERPAAPLPAYRTPSPVAVPGHARRVPVAVWVVLSMTVVAGLLAAMLYSIQALMSAPLDRPLDTSVYYENPYAVSDPAPQPVVVEPPAALSAMLERDYVGYRLTKVYEVVDNNHPDVPVYDVILSHPDYPISIEIHVWAADGEDPETVTEWETSFPFFTAGQGGHPYASELVTYVAGLPEVAECDGITLGTCRNTGSWGDVEAWTCEWRADAEPGDPYWYSYGSSAQVFYVDMTTGEWSTEAPDFNQ